MKMSKKILSLVLSLLMIVSVVPVFSVSAAEDTAVYEPGNLSLRWLASSDYLTDASGHGRNAVANNSNMTWNTSGVYDGLHFNGTSDRIWNNFQVGNLLNSSICGGVEGGSGTTIAFMAKAEDVNSNAPYFFCFNSNYGSNGSKTRWGLEPSGEFYYANGSGNEHKTNGNQPGTTQKADGNWHTYVVKFYSTKNMEIWVDGVKTHGENSDYYDNHTFDIPNVIKLGGNENDGALFRGDIRDFRIYSRDLNATQVHQNLLDCAFKDMVDFTSTGTVSGVITIGNESRWKDGQFNIVNDQEANNTSAGIIEFDISGVAGKTVTEALFNANIISVGDDNPPTGFYYSISESKCAPYVTTGGKETKNVGGNVGSGTTGLNTLLSLCGTDSSKKIGEMTSAGTREFDMKDIIQEAADAGARKIYIIVAKTTAGGKGSADGWTDTKVSPVSQVLTVRASAQEKHYERADITDAVRPNTADVNRGAYTAGATAAADGSYTASSLTGGDSLSGALWTYGVSGNSSFSSCGDLDYFNAGIQYSEVAFLYDGVTQLAFPVTYFIERTKPTVGSSYPQRPFSTYLNNNYAELRHIWHGYSESAGYQTNTEYTVNYVDSLSGLNWHKIRDGRVVDYYSNTIYFKNNAISQNLFVNNLYTISSTNWHFYVQDNNGSKSYYRDFTTSGAGQRIYIINYKPVYDAIQSAKAIYDTVRGNEMNYCPDGLYKFYEAYSKLLAFNPNSYFNPSSTTGNGYDECANALSALSKYIPAATAMPEASNWEYTHDYANGGTQSNLQHTETCSVCGETYTENCTWDGGVETVPATCVQTGVKTFTCTKCSGTYVETEEVSGHEYPETWTVRTAATCTAPGLEYKKCVNCDDEITQEIPQLEHQWGDRLNLNDPNKCYRKCARCGKFDSEFGLSLNHTFTSAVALPTCTQQGYTTHTCVCGYEKVDTYVQATDHTWGEWASDGENTKTHSRVCENDAYHTETVDCTFTSQIILDSTCAAEGIKKYTCTVCGATYTEVIGMKEHTPDASVEENRVNASCMVDGSYDTVIYCVDCKAEISRVTSVITAVGHTSATAVEENRTEAGCLVDGGYDSVVYCTVCNEELSREHKTLSATGHNTVVDEAVAPTCSETGLTEGSHCANCGEVFVAQTVIGKLTHDYDSIITKKATCTATGVKTFTCKNCGDVYTETLPAAGHKEVTVFGTAPTCSATGLTQGSKCSVCGIVMIPQEIIEKLPHTPGAAADCTTAQTCTVCGEEVNPALGHDYGNATCTEAAVCKRCGESSGTAIGHDYKGLVTAPNCTEGGYTTYTCTRCSDAYTADFTSPAGHKGGTANCVDKAICSVCGVAYGEVDANNHKTVVKDPAVDATCHSTGLTEGSHCYACGETVVAQTTVDMIAHTFTNYVSNGDAKCLEDGTKTATCDYCDATSTVKDTGSAKGHTPGDPVQKNYVDSTCTKVGTYKEEIRCVDCDALISSDVKTIAIKAHTPGEPAEENRKEATCTVPGSYDIVVRCTSCNGVISSTKVTLPKLDHTPGEAKEENRIEASCTWAGKYDTVVRCTGCNIILSSKTTEIEKLPHTEVTVEGTAPTCQSTGLTDGVKCSVCGKVLVAQNIIARAEHSPVDGTRVEPTCTTDGYVTGSVCAYCGKVLSTETTVLSALGHKWGKWIIITPATEEADGERERTCSRCNEKETETYQFSIGDFTRTVRFTCISNMRYVLNYTKGEYSVTHTGQVTWYTGIDLTFYIKKTTGAALGDLHVYLDGEEIQPDENGYYTIPAGEDVANVTVKSDKQTDDDGGNTPGGTTPGGTTPGTCTHSCHSKNAFVKFIWKIIGFICSIFNVNQYCSCGARHW